MTAATAGGYRRATDNCSGKLRLNGNGILRGMGMRCTSATAAAHTRIRQSRNPIGVCQVV
jgi:hypothetical protein